MSCAQPLLPANPAGALHRALATADNGTPWEQKHAPWKLASKGSGLDLCSHIKTTAEANPSSSPEQVSSSGASSSRHNTSI